LAKPDLKRSKKEHEKMAFFPMYGNFALFFKAF
jgi:hypothetical protein